MASTSSDSLQEELKGLHLRLITDITDEVDIKSREGEKFLFHIKYRLGAGIFSSHESLADKIIALETKNVFGLENYEGLKKICTYSGNLNLIKIIETCEDDMKKIRSKYQQNESSESSKEEREGIKRNLSDIESEQKEYKKRLGVEDSDEQKQQEYEKAKSVPWNECIKRKSIQDASILIERNILPSQSEVNEECCVFGRHSTVLSDMCDLMCDHIKMKSQDVRYVWPAYKHVADKKSLSVVFVVVMKKETDMFEFKDYDMKFTYEKQCSDEGKLVASEKLKDKTVYTEYANIQQMRVCINENADDLFKRHSNLNVILPSLNKSTGYNAGKHVIKVLPCIALYVKLKGYIPLKEEPFQKYIGPFQIDVLEGQFTPFTGRATDFHDNLKIGLAIHGKGSVGGGTLGGFIDHRFHGLCGITCAHVVYSSHELKQIKESNSFVAKEVYQPIGEGSSAFGEAVLPVYQEGDMSGSGVDVALIKIKSRHPKDGSFPTAFNDRKAGFDENKLLCFNSGEVCERSNIKLRTEVYKFGMSTGITRGSFDLQGAAMRSGNLEGQNENLSYKLKDQMVILQIGKNPFANFGDSGALVLKEGNQDSVAIGLVEGYFGTGEIVVTPICDILRAIGCTEMKMCQFSTIPNTVIPDTRVEMEI